MAPLNDLSNDFFSLFALPRRFAIDGRALDRAYRGLQTNMHPDKYAAATDAEKRLAMQWTTRINEGYQTLKHPTSRARYLLKLAGVDTQEETNTAMPRDFLMKQMTWREAIEEAAGSKNEVALDALLNTFRIESGQIEAELTQALDEATNHARGAELVRMLRFIDKLIEETEDALLACES